MRQNVLFTIILTVIFSASAQSQGYRYDFSFTPDYGPAGSGFISIDQVSDGSYSWNTAIDSYNLQLAFEFDGNFWTEQHLDFGNEGSDPVIISNGGTNIYFGDPGGFPLQFINLANPEIEGFGFMYDFTTGGYQPPNERLANAYRIGDSNGSGSVGNEFGEGTFSYIASVNAVPEPSVFAAALGLFCLFITLHRKKKT